MSLTGYILLFASVMLSGMWALRQKSIRPQRLKLLLAFSGAFLFALCALHLIPDVYSGGGNNVGYFILAGFLLQLVLEFFSEGIEHGHIHVHKEHHHAFPFAIIFSLSLHSFLEGMPLSEHNGDSHVHDSLLTGIILHHIPVAMALTAMLLQSGVKKQTIVICLLLFAGMAPLGAFVSTLLGEGRAAILSEYYPQIMALVIGIFLHISTTILFESTEDHRFNYLRMATIGAGVATAILTL
jgi:zinc transporter ZupT